MRGLTGRLDRLAKRLGSPPPETRVLVWHDDKPRPEADPTFEGLTVFVHLTEADPQTPKPSRA